MDLLGPLLRDNFLFTHNHFSNTIKLWRQWSKLKRKKLEQMLEYASFSSMKNMLKDQIMRELPQRLDL
jgi:hypothetical protein